MAGASQILSKYRKSIRDDYSIVKHSKAGVNSKIFFELVELSGINRNILAEEIFDVSVKTMLRYNKENRKLSARQSELALKLLSLIDKGIDVFSNIESFMRWLQKPALGLGNQKPIGMLNTNTGIDLIEEELIRIEFGSLS